VTTATIASGNTDADGDGNAAFAIARDGTVTVNDPADLDAEAQPSFTLTIEASDAAGNTGTGEVTVNVSAASGGFADTQDADTLTGTNKADTLVLVADGQNDSFDAKDDFERDTLDLSGLDPAQLRDGAPTVDLRDGVVETAISGKDTIANFDTVIGSDTGDTFLGRDSSDGVLIGSSEPTAPTLAEIVDEEQFVDGGGSDTIRLRGGQGIASLTADGTTESELSASSSDGLGQNGLDVSRATGGVQVDLAAQGTDANVIAGGGIGDQPGTTVSGFNSVEGSDFADTLSAPEIVIDGDGQDDVTLTSGGTGRFFPSADGVSETSVQAQADGELLLLGATSGVTVDLSAQASEALVYSGGGLGEQSGTSMSGFADVEGSSNADTLEGNTSGNRLNGLNGDDQLRGGAGDDTIVASDGSDTLTGGAGADNFDPDDFFDPSTGINEITDFDPGEGDVISLGSFGDIGSDQDIAVELRPDTALPDFTTAQDGFFTDDDNSGEVPNILVFDNGTDRTRIFIDGNGDGNYRPNAGTDEDSAIDVTGTINSTGISADAITAL
jgi:Ca2+-binding RTX toxin-like protein